MAKQSVEQLYQMALSDPKLQQKLNAAGDLKHRVQVLLDLAKGQGYQLNASEVGAFFAAKEGAAEGVLSDEALDTVVGGAIPDIGGGTSSTGGGGSDDDRGQGSGKKKKKD